MTHVCWMRYLMVGEQLATREPDFFPTVVVLLETLADANALRELVEAVASLPSAAEGD